MWADFFCSLPVIAIVISFIVEVATTENFSQDEAGLSFVVGGALLSFAVICFLIILTIINYTIISRDLYIKRKAILIGSFAIMDFAIFLEYLVGGPETHQFLDSFLIYSFLRLFQHLVYSAQSFSSWPVLDLNAKPWQFKFSIASLEYARSSLRLQQYFLRQDLLLVLDLNDPLTQRHDEFWRLPPFSYRFLHRPQSQSPLE